MRQSEVEQKRGGRGAGERGTDHPNGPLSDRNTEKYSAERQRACEGLR